MAGIAPRSSLRMTSYLKSRVEDRVESFFQAVPISDLICESRPGEPKKNLDDVLRSCGFILTRSDFVILDHSRIGNFTIIIARYNLDYVDDGNNSGKTISVDGSVAIKIDGSGNREIWLSLKTDPFGSHFDPVYSGTTPIGSKI
jgi:hypothetical protein